MGGFAIQGVRKVTGEEARATLPYIKAFMSKFKIDISLLIGSAWHRTDGLSGDLDIGVIASPSHDFTWVMNAKLGKVVQGKAMPGISVYSFGFPICGKSANGIVQVDLMPVYYPEWSKFVYARVPGNAKSAHRNWLLWALAKSKGVKFDLNKGAIKTNGEFSSTMEVTSDPEQFLNWLGITAEEAVSYETLSKVVPPEVIYEAAGKLSMVK